MNKKFFAGMLCGVLTTVFVGFLIQNNTGPDYQVRAICKTGFDLKIEDKNLYIEPTNIADVTTLLEMADSEKPIQVKELALSQENHSLIEEKASSADALVIVTGTNPILCPIE